MKKMSKKLVAIVLLGVMMFCLTACGVDMSKVKGDWKIKTVDGKTPEEYLKEKNIDPSAVYYGYSITDKKITEQYLGVEGAKSKEYDVIVRADGIEAKDGDKVVIALKLEGENLTMKAKIAEGVEAQFVFEKGKADLDKVYNDLIYGDEEGYDEDYEEE